MLYVAVGLAGLYAAVVGLGDTRPVLFAGGLAALFALEVVERRRFPVRTPSAPAAVLLAARLALFVVVAAGDGSGLSRILLVLAPFTAYFAFGRTVATGLAVLCLGLAVVADQLTAPGWGHDLERISDLLMLAVGLVLAIAMAAVAVAEQQGRARLAESHRQLRLSARRVEELSAAAERARLARDIHDSLGHHLTAVAVLLEKAETFRSRDAAAADQAVADARGSARRALDEVRLSVRSLRGERAPLRLPAALAELAAAGGDVPEVTVEIAGTEAGFPAPAVDALFRAAQEAITNARRHAGATRVLVRVEFDEVAARLLVVDDGRGFHPDREGYGLLGMRERVHLVGGRVELDGGPGRGTRITVTIPCAGPPRVIAA